MNREKNIRNKINTLIVNEDFDKLFQYCDEEIKIDNQNYVIFGARGRVKLLLEKYDEAIIDITKALQINENYYIGYYNRGICNYFLGILDLAILDFTKAKEIGIIPDDINFYLGSIYDLMDDYNNALLFYNEYLQNYDDIFALNSRAQLFYKTGKNKKANYDIEKILYLEKNQINDLKKINNTPKVDTKSKIKLAKFSDIKLLGFYSISEQEIRSGIYILEFFKNEYYIGQSRRIKTRIKQHYKKYSKIKCVYFKPIEPDLLLEQENETISIFEKSRLRIKNVKQIKFMNLFDSEQQEKWKKDYMYNHIDGIKFNSDNLGDRFIEIQQKEYFNELINHLSSYISTTIPNYLAGEYNYWNITCKPKYFKKTKCISRININEVPVLSIFEESECSYSMMFYVSKLLFLEHLENNQSLQSIFK